MTLDRLIPHLDTHLRMRLARSSTSQPDDLLTAHNLAIIEIHLAGRLQQAGRREDAFALLLESEAKLDVLCAAASPRMASSVIVHSCSFTFSPN